MKIDPLKRYRRKPHALLSPGPGRRLRVTTLDGANDYRGRAAVENVLATLKGHACYVEGRLQELRHTTGARSWVLHTWKGREARMVHVPSGVVVTSLRGTLDGSPEPFDSLSTLLAWLDGFGVTAGSLSGMAWSLLRASLSAPVTVSADPDVTAGAFYGPRQELREPGLFHGLMAVDMRAAYPSNMAARPYALSLREVDKATTLDPDVAGMAHARVQVPSFLGHPPLPVRVADACIQFQRGAIEGTWPWCELAAAISIGCDVEVERCYAPRREGDLFYPWWAMAQTGRELADPFAANAAKAVSNCTWGQCAMSGDNRAEVHWSDDAGNSAFSVDLPLRDLPHRYMLHVAAETTARVRTRLLTDVLYAGPHPPLHVDTDGVIISDRSALPLHFGDGFGEWAVKAIIYEMDARAPQFYRWTCSDCEVEHAKWHTVASGVPASAAPEWFRTNAPRGTRVAFAGDFDAVLPSCDAGDAAAIAKAMGEANWYGVRVGV